MEKETREVVAEEIFQGYANKVVFQTLADMGHPATLDEAYDIQQRVYTRIGEAGGGPHIAGHKIAATSAAIQDLLGIDEPAYGSIPAGKVFETPQTLSRGSFLRLGLEFEIAFVLKHDLPFRDGGYDEEAIREHVSHCMPAFEIIEDRGADYSNLDAPSMIADRCWCDGVILGTPTYELEDLDMATLPVKLYKNGELYDTALAGAALGNPLSGLCWIANHLQKRGETIKVGQFCITGSSLKTEFASACEAYRLTIGGLGEVFVEVT